MTNDHMWEWSTNVSTRIGEEQPGVRSEQSWSTTVVAVTEDRNSEVEDVSVVSSVQVWGNTTSSGGGGGYGDDNWWALLALALVFGTAAGNILVCLAISWERRLQNVTNYFLMSLAITDLMVAVLVMPLGILTLVRGFFPLPPVYCLAWICLDVLFCTASIMHLCTISVDRYLSLRYPMKFGRNKTRRRVTLKIVFVWLLSIAMSLPLSLMYSQDYNSVLVEGTCQIPDPLYKLIGSIVSFYIPLGVMLLTYALTVRLLAVQQQNLGGCGTGWSSGWLGGPPSLGIERRCTWRRFLLYTGTSHKPQPATPQHMPSMAAHHSSTDTDLTTLDTHELWLPESEPTPSTMSALHQFGAEMLRLSRGLESAMVAQPVTLPPPHKHANYREITFRMGTDDDDEDDDDDTNHPPTNGANVTSDEKKTHRKAGYRRRRRASTIHEPYARKAITKSTLEIRRRVSSYHESLNNKWTTSESSSAEEQQTKPTSHNEEDGDDEDDGYRLDAVNTCRKHSGVSEHELGYQLLRTECKNNSEHNDRSSGSHADSDDEGDKQSQTRKTEDQTEEDPLKLLPPPCTCPYFGDSESSKKVSPNRTNDVVIITTTSTEQNRSMKLTPYERRRKLGFNSVKLNDNDSISSCVTRSGSSSIRLPNAVKRPGSSFASESSGAVVTWEPTPTRNRRGSFSSGSCASGGTVRTMVLSKSSETSPAMRKVPILRRAVTLKMTRKDVLSESAAQGILLRYGSASGIKRGGSNTVRTHHSRNSSVMSRTSSRHGRIIRLEQKATKVLGVVFFTFVILWAPFFVLNLVPSICAECERNIDRGVFDFVTWLGYASSMVNPIFYTIFNKVFRQAFKKVLLCKYHKKKNWKPSSKAKL